MSDPLITCARAGGGGGGGGGEKNEREREAIRHITPLVKVVRSNDMVLAPRLHSFVSAKFSCACFRYKDRSVFACTLLVVFT